jgi:hypothetical protein
MLSVKGKGKFVPVLFLTEHHVTKVYWGSGGIAPLILWLRQQTEVTGQFHAPAILLQRTKLPPPVPTGQEAGWAPEPVWMRWLGEKNPIIAQVGNWPPVIQLVA